MKNHYVISFNDLSKEKQAEIKKDLVLRLVDDKKAQASAEVFDNILESIEATVEQACDKSWVEWEVTI